jgi:nicotinamidase-related amidase
MRLPVRQYRCYPLAGAEYDESQFGYVERTLELDPTHTALITVDLWDMGWHDEPLVPDLGRYWEHNFVGLGRRACAEARRVTEENLAPALGAARDAGLTVVHSTMPHIVRKHPENARTASTPPARATPAPASDPWPPPEVSQAVLREYTETTYGPGAEAAWERMREAADFPPPVMPAPGDFCVSEQAAIEEILRERRVTTVIHVGFLLAHCLLDKPGGVRSMSAIWRSGGYRDIVLRDGTVAQESHETIADFGVTKAFIFWLEATGTPTATSREFVAALKGDG